MLAKPAYGSPCNKCGLCCEDRLCPFGSMVFEQQAGPCPALQFNADGTGTCGLAEHPHIWAPIRAAIIGEENLREAALLLIGADSGCDALLEGENVNEGFRANLRHRAAKGRQKANRALDTWGLAGGKNA